MSPQGHTGGGGHRFQLRTPEWPWVFVPVAQGSGYEEACYILSSTPPKSPVTEPSLHRKDSGQGGGDPGQGPRLQRRRGAVGGCRTLGGVPACWAPTGVVLYGWFTLLSCIFTCKWGPKNLRATRCSLSHRPRSANSQLDDLRASPAGFLANLFRFRWCGHSALAQRRRTEGGQVRGPLCGVPLPSRAPWRLGVLRNPGHG